MKMPRKFVKYPWITAAIAVALFLATLYGVADVLGADWLRDTIDFLLGRQIP